MNDAIVATELTKLWPDKSYGLREVSLRAEQGAITALIGRNGSGKTTLLRIIAALAEPTTGTLSNPFGTAGIVFQGNSLWPHLTVLEQLIIPLTRVCGHPTAIAKQAAFALLRRFGVAALSNRYPFELSGGQQQKVALARTLSVEPKVICLDEVTSALDPLAKADIYRCIDDLRSEGRVVLVSTHDLHYAARHADSVYYLVDGALAAAGSSSSVMKCSDDPFFDILK